MDQALECGGDNDEANAFWKEEWRVDKIDNELGWRLARSFERKEHGDEAIEFLEAVFEEKKISATSHIFHTPRNSSRNNSDVLELLLNGVNEAINLLGELLHLGQILWLVKV